MVSFDKHGGKLSLESVLHPEVDKLFCFQLLFDQICVLCYCYSVGVRYYSVGVRYLVGSAVFATPPKAVRYKNIIVKKELEINIKRSPPIMLVFFRQ